LQNAENQLVIRHVAANSGERNGGKEKKKASWLNKGRRVCDYREVGTNGKTIEAIPLLNALT